MKLCAGCENGREDAGEDLYARLMVRKMQLMVKGVIDQDDD